MSVCSEATSSPGAQVSQSAIITPSFAAPKRKLPWLENSPSPSTARTADDSASQIKNDPSSAHNTMQSPFFPAPPPEMPRVADAATISSAGLDQNSIRLPTTASDLAMREIGSAPSMRPIKGHRRYRKPRRLSLDTELRPGLKPYVSKNAAKHFLLAAPSSATPLRESSVSDYSTTIPPEQDTMPTEFPKRCPASYEMLVQKSSGPVSNTNHQHRSSPRPLQAANDGNIFGREEVRQHALAQRRESAARRSLQRRRHHRQRQTLRGLPSHLAASSSSSAMSPIGSMSALPTAATPAPLQPESPRRSDPTSGSNGTKLRGAVASLDALIDDAGRLAGEAAGVGRTNDVAAILEHAAQALRKAGTATKNADYPLTPLSSESDFESGSTDDSDIYSDASFPISTRTHSVETLPTTLTKSAQSSRLPLHVHSLADADDDSYVPSIGPSNRPLGSAPSLNSITQTPPRLYQPASVDSIVRDFAYARMRNENAERAKPLGLPQPTAHGAAADYYGDGGQSVVTQPGSRPSFSADKVDLEMPAAARSPPSDLQPKLRRAKNRQLQTLEPVSIAPADPADPHTGGQKYQNTTRSRNDKSAKHHHIADFYENAYYRTPAKDDVRRISTVTDSSAPNAHLIPTQNISLKHPRRKHISLREGQGFSLGRYHRRQPIAREWHTVRKRITAAIACFNTLFIGLIAGIYAGEVPRIQYTIADISHKVILGNVLLFLGLGITTVIFWPLPLLHGRKPYTLMAFALMLPLQFPQALSVSTYRDPDNPLYRCGLLIPRLFTGISMGFANVNQLPTLFDLFGVSLMSERPHEEIVVYDDVRRQGGGVGIWLGIWSFCFVGSLSVGFCAGACIISALDPAWGFYIIVILLAVFMLINVIVPETRRAPYRRSIAQFLDDDENVRRRVARGEVKLHISNEGPRWWFEEVWAGIVLSKRMLMQTGFFVLCSYVAWIYCQITLVVLLLGALLSRDYRWRPQFVGLAVLALAVGALFALPLAKASLFSRSRYTPQRTDSMTMRAPRLTWTSHLARRCAFTLLLPFAGLAFTLASPGQSVSWVAPTIFAGLVGFLSNLAIAECVGLIMEVFDTCDLQPGVNQRHRLQSMSETTRRRRTNYSSFPRVCAGFFCAQGLGFFLAAAATGVSGTVTRALGAQTSTAIVAAILLIITLLLMIVLFRFKRVQVVPNGPAALFPTSDSFGRSKNNDLGAPKTDDADWKPVIIGNPSGKLRRVNLLELGSLSRWTEIRKLNKLTKSQ